MRSILQHLTAFLSLIFPPLCLACGSALNSAEAVICLVCRHKLPKTNYHTMPANPIAKTFYGRVQVQGAAAYYKFTKGGKVQNLVHALKYHGRADVGHVIGWLYGSEIKHSPPFNTISTIIPVPLHPAKLKQRGFNQSAAFAVGLAKATGMQLNVTTLVRIRQTDTQTKKSRIDRVKNMQGVFKVIDPTAIAGQHVLLVDDVITTGATLEACAIELLKVPNVKVSIAAIAYAEI